MVQARKHIPKSDTHRYTHCTCIYTSPCVLYPGFLHVAASSLFSSTLAAADLDLDLDLGQDPGRGPCAVSGTLSSLSTVSVHHLNGQHLPNRKQEAEAGC